MYILAARCTGSMLRCFRHSRARAYEEIEVEPAISKFSLVVPAKSRDPSVCRSGLLKQWQRLTGLERFVTRRDGPGFRRGDRKTREGKMPSHAQARERTEPARGGG